MSARKPFPIRTESIVQLQCMYKNFQAQNLVQKLVSSLTEYNIQELIDELPSEVNTSLAQLNSNLRSFEDKMGSLWGLARGLKEHQKSC